MSKLLKGLIILSFFIFFGCETETIIQQDSPPPQKNTPKKNTPKTIIIDNPKPNNCKSEFISDKATDCFFILPDIQNGNTFTGKYVDTLQSQTKGITVGKGEWICQNGTWYQLNYRFVCLTCLPQHDLEHCQTELERLIKINP